MPPARTGRGVLLLTTYGAVFLRVLLITLLIRAGHVYDLRAGHVITSGPAAQIRPAPRQG